jgi:hypothetical protein
MHETNGSLRLIDDFEWMTSSTSAFEPAIRRLERQTAASIHIDINLLTVVREFDVSEVAVYDD